MPRERKSEPDDKEMALALNRMERSLETGFECDFHDSCMKRIGDGIPLTPKMSLKLREIYLKYFPDGEAESEEEDDDIDGEVDL